MYKLLSRDEFRSKVFERDNHKCVICERQAVDAHHIIERRLWNDEGYYLENGASLCENCHIEAEKTLISCEEIRKAANINFIILPEHFYSDLEYDKWGNIILANGDRLKGELFNDESVQKILKAGNVLNLFSKYIKYPRTYHLPFSESVGKDDRVLENTDVFKNKEVIVTVKMDGENSTLYSDYYHPRSIDASSHPSREWVKKIHSQVQGDIPENWRICGENLYAKHSILYTNLASYFYMFSIWNDNNVCLSWDETIEWAELLNLKLVDVIYRGIYDESIIKGLYRAKILDNECEGFVLRLASQFHYGQFRRSVAKFVRKNHVMTSTHWRFEKIIPNQLKRG